MDRAAQSNVGTWMQTVGAQWTLVHQPHATTPTSAVQAASLLPVLFLPLPAGVLADVLDRRILLITLAGAMAALCGALRAMTAAGLTTPAVLIALTFLAGRGQALTGPGRQAVQPELVPREQIPAAVALGSLNVNLARAVGPAVAGLIAAATGPDVVFGINGASFLAVAAAGSTWPTPRAATRPAPTTRAAGTRRCPAASGCPARSAARPAGRTSTPTGTWSSGTSDAGGAPAVRRGAPNTVGRPGAGTRAADGTRLHVPLVTAGHRWSPLLAASPARCGAGGGRYRFTTGWEPAGPRPAGGRRR
ncbi:MFS transporter [Actinacidiphila sp. ITFR-21]|uniref:MFS transporter n=1 Tax=Actinacidiphila sp. ITFR-21 TaxID=3075199 RepID=UPI00288A3923|nr:MFS transporter [Streptomyces sp. ITFR-21]WNI17447.1 MFS transporter [Streptomyces sp. ITFR-21]